MIYLVNVTRHLIALQTNTLNADWGFEKAKCYLPVRLSATCSDEIGEFIFIVANIVSKTNE